ncbi:MAG: ABC transporter permease subunit [Chitinophagaceae bacterium]|nr:ABC transporter permease subunit [Rubrivivax sp.]
MSARSPALRQTGGLWAFAPWITTAVFLLPVAAGVVGTALPAFGYLPAIGGDHPSAEPWRALVEQPGLMTSVRLSVQTGLLATALSLALAASFCALLQDHAIYRRLSTMVSPLLATPHVALAIGLAFVIAPSGWLLRLASPMLTGWDRPPVDLVTVRDPQGLAVVLGLVLKEVPYLILMITAALGQIPHAALRRTGAALGYRPAGAWFKLVFPPVYTQLRLPVYAVLAFSMSTVEVGLILGPGNPPPLALLAARWFADYDLQRYFPASAAATLQGLLVLAALLVWRAGELGVARIGRAWCERGVRAGAIEPLTRVSAGLSAIALALGLVALLGTAVWSLAQSWRFPAALPEQWTTQTWALQLPRMAETVITTIGLALASALAGVLLAVACLEAETRRGHAPTQRVLWLVYAPLLVPQIAFLYGFQVVLVKLGLDGSWLAVAWAHLVFVLPYAFLSLADPWRALDPRYARSAAALGVTPWQVLYRVRLPMLLKPLLLAFAIGCAVSVGQYLPTLFAGAGRVATLTTEAVTLSSGADPRIMGVHALLQAGIPLLVYGAALMLPALLYRRRKGMA